MIVEARGSKKSAVSNKSFYLVEKMEGKKGENIFG